MTEQISSIVESSVSSNDIFYHIFCKHRCQLHVFLSCLIHYYKSNVNAKSHSCSFDIRSSCFVDKFAAKSLILANKNFLFFLLFLFDNGIKHSMMAPNNKMVSKPICRFLYFNCFVFHTQQFIV